VAEAVDLPVDVGPVAQGKGLVDANVAKQTCAGLDRVEERHRFSVPQADDDVSLGRHVVEHRLTGAPSLLERRLNARRH
jgi:hypothetical protein